MIVLVYGYASKYEIKSFTEFEKFSLFFSNFEILNLNIAVSITFTVKKFFKIDAFTKGSLKTSLVFHRKIVISIKTMGF